MSNILKTSNIDLDAFISRHEKLDKERDNPNVTQGRSTSRGFNFFTKPSPPARLPSKVSVMGTNEDLKIDDKQREGNMSENITRTELEALLRANKSEIDAIAAKMREDAAKQREEINVQMANMNATLSSILAKFETGLNSISSNFEIIETKISTNNNVVTAKIDGIDKSLNAKIDGLDKAINGKVDGINTGITGIQSGMSTKLTRFGVATGAIVTIIAAIAGVVISQISPQQKNTETLTPIVVNVPAPIIQPQIPAIQTKQQIPPDKTESTKEQDTHNSK
ncbi:hypothetical protein [Proteus terrae]|uniref:hypothetical protein n=1 Tax=Proteus terrae TaxID=1574161 RepID=UPI00298CDD29|nr:hypothetical protein [Proteus terrae]WPD00390.1 hypothetical protein R5P25_07735 [Proteus terrae]